MSKKEDSDEVSDDDSDEKFKDPSLQKAKDLQKFIDDPIRIPGLDVLTVEPQASLLASNLLGMVIKRISDPNLTANIMDNISKSLELSLENKKNKIEYLKHDKGFKNKNNSMIINSIHNGGVTQQPTEVISPANDIPQSIVIKEKDEKKDEEKDEKKEEKTDEKKEEEKKEEKTDEEIKGGSLSFFTEQECSFF